METKKFAKWAGIPSKLALELLQDALQDALQTTKTTKTCASQELSACKLGQQSLSRRPHVTAWHGMALWHPIRHIVTVNQHATLDSPSAFSFFPHFYPPPFPMASQVSHGIPGIPGVPALAPSPFLCYPPGRSLLSTHTQFSPLYGVRAAWTGNWARAIETPLRLYAVRRIDPSSNSAAGDQRPAFCVGPTQVTAPSDSGSALVSCTCHLRQIPTLFHLVLYD